MKKFKFTLLLVIIMVALATVFIQPLFAQGDPNQGFTFPPYILVIPLLVGMAGHWLKGFTRGTISGNIFTWFSDRVSLTIPVVIAGIGQLVTMYQLTPWLAQGGASAWWVIFLMGYTSDSIFNGEKQAPKL